MTRHPRLRFDLATARAGLEPSLDGEPASNGERALSRVPDGVTCPLCGRPIPPNAKASKHHLTPKLKGGAKLGTVLLHQICHSAIHARFSDAEIARDFAEIERLREAPEMADFLRWVATKPADFHVRTASTRDRRSAKQAKSRR